VTTHHVPHNRPADKPVQDLSSRTRECKAPSPTRMTFVRHLAGRWQVNRI
jgi:hypothetical protein